MTSGFVFVTPRTNANQSMSDPSYLSYFVLLLSNLILAQRREHHNRFLIYRIIWKPYRDLKIEKIFFQDRKTKTDSCYWKRFVVFGFHELYCRRLCSEACVRFKRDHICENEKWGLRERTWYFLWNFELVKFCPHGSWISWAQFKIYFSGVRSCRSSDTSSQGKRRNPRVRSVRSGRKGLSWLMLLISMI